jgi:hypothetical protein
MNTSKSVHSEAESRGRSVSQYSSGSSRRSTSDMKLGERRHREIELESSVHSGYDRGSYTSRSSSKESTQSLSTRRLTSVRNKPERSRSSKSRNNDSKEGGSEIWITEKRNTHLQKA